MIFIDAELIASREQALRRSKWKITPQGLSLHSLTRATALSNSQQQQRAAP
jgi:hypothetical protein